MRLPPKDDKLIGDLKSSSNFVNLANKPENQDGIETEGELEEGEIPILKSRELPDKSNPFGIQRVLIEQAAEQKEKLKSVEGPKPWQKDEELDAAKRQVIEETQSKERRSPVLKPWQVGNRIDKEHVKTKDIFEKVMTTFEKRELPTEMETLIAGKRSYPFPKSKHIQSPAHADGLDVDTESLFSYSDHGGKKKKKNKKGGKKKDKKAKKDIMEDMEAAEIARKELEERLAAEEEAARIAQEIAEAAARRAEDAAEALRMAYEVSRLLGDYPDDEGSGNNNQGAAAAAQSEGAALAVKMAEKVTKVLGESIGGNLSDIDEDTLSSVGLASLISLNTDAAIYQGGKGNGNKNKKNKDKKKDKKTSSTSKTTPTTRAKSPPPPPQKPQQQPTSSSDGRSSEKKGRTNSLPAFRYNIPKSSSDSTSEEDQRVDPPSSREEKEQQQQQKQDDEKVIGKKASGAAKPKTTTVSSSSGNAKTNSTIRRPAKAKKTNIKSEEESGESSGNNDNNNNNEPDGYRIPEDYDNPPPNFVINVPYPNYFESSEYIQEQRRKQQQQEYERHQRKKQERQQQEQEQEQQQQQQQQQQHSGSSARKKKDDEDDEGGDGDNNSAGHDGIQKEEEVVDTRTSPLGNHDEREEELHTPTSRSQSNYVQNNKKDNSNVPPPPPLPNDTTKPMSALEKLALIKQVLAKAQDCVKKTNTSDHQSGGEEKSELPAATPTNLESSENTSGQRAGAGPGGGGEKSKPRSSLKSIGIKNRQNKRVSFQGVPRQQEATAAANNKDATQVEMVTLPRDVLLRILEDDRLHSQFEYDGLMEQMIGGTDDSDAPLPPPKAVFEYNAAATTTNDNNNDNTGRPFDEIQAEVDLWQQYLYQADAFLMDGMHSLLRSTL